HTVEGALDVRRALADGDDGPDARRLPRQHAEVEALVLPAGDEHDRVEGTQRGQRRVGRGRLRVVVPLDAVLVGNELDAVAEPAEGDERVMAPVDGRATGPCGRGGGQRVGNVVREGAPELRGAAHDRAVVGDERVAVDVVVGTGVEPERDVAGGRVREVPAYDGVVRRSDGDVRGRLVAPQLRLRRLVGVERAMQVEVIGREVQPRADVGREVLAVVEAERGRLHHEHVRRGVVDGGDEGQLVVAGFRGPHGGGL